LNVVPDTMVLFKACEDRLPEKWLRIWKQIRSGTYRLFLTEPVISELYYLIEENYGRDSATAKVLALKAMRHELQGDPDKLSFLAADLRARHNNLSIADRFSIAAAIIYSGRLLTTDHGIRDAARKERCEVDYLPREELQ